MLRVGTTYVRKDRRLYSVSTKISRVAYKFYTYDQNLRATFSVRNAYIRRELSVTALLGLLGLPLSSKALWSARCINNYRWLCSLRVPGPVDEHSSLY
jgi:hypothetical protein